MLKFIDGYKSYVIGAIAVLTGIAELIGIDVVGEVTQATAFSHIMAGFAMFAVKSAIAKTAPPPE